MRKKKELQESHFPTGISDFKFLPLRARGVLASVDGWGPGVQDPLLISCFPTGVLAGIITKQ